MSRAQCLGFGGSGALDAGWGGLGLTGSTGWEAAEWMLCTCSILHAVLGGTWTPTGCTAVWVRQQGHREATCLLSSGGAVRACVASNSDAACRRSHRGHATQDPQDVRSTLRPKPQPHCPLCSKHVCAYALLLCCIRRPIPTPQPCRERVDGVLSTTAAAIPNIHACAMPCVAMGSLTVRPPPFADQLGGQQSPARKR